MSKGNTFLIEFKSVSLRITVSNGLQHAACKNADAEVSVECELPDKWPESPLMVNLPLDL